MRKLLLAFVFSFLALFSFAQNEEAKKLVTEGIALHDKGDYVGAVSRYDEALKMEKDYYDALYEKSLSLLYAKNYKTCIEICRQLLDRFPDKTELAQVYSNYGSALDDSGEPKDAIKMYEKGLKKFPGFYLLHFNRALTLTRMKKYEDALEGYSDALRCNALHPASNYYTGMLLQGNNRIPSVMAYATLVALEPQSQRGREAAAAILEQLHSNVKKEGNNTTIFISADMLDNKAKKGPNNFSSIEMPLSLMASLEDAKGIDSIAKTRAEKFDLKLQLLINMLSAHQKDGRGFYWEHYVPFFTGMKAKGFTIVLSNLILMHTDTQAKAWVSLNSEKLGEFYSWAEKFEWAKK